MRPAHVAGVRERNDAIKCCVDGLSGSRSQFKLAPGLLYHRQNPRCVTTGEWCSTTVHSKMSARVRK